MTQARSLESGERGRKDQRAPIEQEIVGKVFAAPGRTYPNGQRIETRTDTPKSDGSESYQS